MFKLNKAFLCFCFLSACSQALPKNESVSDIQKSVIGAREAETKAASYAQQCHDELKLSEQMIAEAREILSRAEEARAYCVGVNKILNKSKQTSVYKAGPSSRKYNLSQKSSQSVSNNSNLQSESSSIQQASSEPPYAPSDAPSR